MSGPELVAVGHVTWDVLPDDLETKDPGGAVAFASATARGFGISTAIITSCADDYPIEEIVGTSGRLVRIPSEDTSTFENRYDASGDRVQVLHRRGGDISVADIPDAWRSPDMLFVGPLAQELPVGCLGWFRPRVSCVVAQGWLRSWNEPLPSVVEVSKSPPVGMSPGWDICVISESEIEPQSLDEWRGITNHLIVTKGREGADLYSRGRQQEIRIHSFADEVAGAGADTTGAGDVFAAAMLVRYTETGNAYQAANYASVCAALSTRARSWSAVEEPRMQPFNSPFSEGEKGEGFGGVYGLSRNGG